MARSPEIFSEHFKVEPYWWEEFTPFSSDTEIFGKIDVAVVGGGYAGLTAARELKKNNTDVVVLEAGLFGEAASTRNGGAVSSGINIGKGITGKQAFKTEVEGNALLRGGYDSFIFLRKLIEEEGIACDWQHTGRFVGAWSRDHYDSMARRVDVLNEVIDGNCYMLPPSRQREEIASDFYHGGMVLNNSGKIQPALLFSGLLTLCRSLNVKLCSSTAVKRIKRDRGGWMLTTNRGNVHAKEVIVATNGYTGPTTPGLRRRVIPVASQIITTEELDPDLATPLIPKGRTISETCRLLCYYRMSPCGKRVVFGGRARSNSVEPIRAANTLYGQMVERFPQLKGTRITHTWKGNVAFTFDALPHLGRTGGLYYCLGCNGSGVAMMTYLGHQVARKVLTGADKICIFDMEKFPGHPLYTGNTWFLSLAGDYFGLLDALERRKSQ